MSYTRLRFLFPLTVKVVSSRRSFAARVGLGTSTGDTPLSSSRLWLVSFIVSYVITEGVVPFFRSDNLPNHFYRPNFPFYAPLLLHTRRQHGKPNRGLGVPNKNLRTRKESVHLPVQIVTSLFLQIVGVLLEVQSLKTSSE